jgi:hypothetical protein
MENFFKWLSVPIDREELEVYFNMNNIIREKLDLFSDILHTLNIIIDETYLGNNITNDMYVSYSEEDKTKHFDWCWLKTIDSFKKENILLKENGEHKNYLKNFYLEIFYSKKNKVENVDISKFVSELFSIDGDFSKADLEILTELYKVLDKNIEFKKFN